MNQQSVDDFVGSIVLAWYARVSQWVPPGEPPFVCCEICRDSLLGIVMDLAEWPHDVMHELAAALDLGLGHVYVSLSEQHGPDLLDPVVRRSQDRQARRLVTASLFVRSAELSDVLEQCIRFRIDEQMLELERGLLEFG